MAAAVTRHLIEPEQSKHFRALVHRGAGPKATGERQTTAMHLAASSVNAGVMQVLYDAGADFDVPNSDSFTPMHFGEDRGAEAVIDLLVGWGADLNARSSLGVAPIDIVSNSVSAIRALAKTGAYIDTRDRNGWTPSSRRSPRAEQPKPVVSSPSERTWTRSLTVVPPLFTLRSAPAIRGAPWLSSRQAPTST